MDKKNQDSGNRFFQNPNNMKKNQTQHQSRMGIGFTYWLLWIVFVFVQCQHKAPAHRPSETNLSGKIFAVPTGTVADQMVLKAYPDAKILYFNTVHDCALAVSSGKADATVYDLPVLKNIAARTGGLKVLPQLLQPDDYGFAVQKENISLKQAIDETVSQLRADGTYDDMLARWLPETGAPAAMPPFDFVADAEPLRFGTAAVTEPMAFVDENQQLAGFDIELASHVAMHLNRRLEVVNMDFGGLLPALISGKVDFVGAGMSITAERAKQVLFSESYYKNGIAVMVRDHEDAPQTASPAASTTLKKQSVGVLMGSIHEKYAREKYEATAIHTFNGVTDMLQALEGNKIEGAYVDDNSVKEILHANPGFTIIDSNTFKVDIAAGFAKESKALRADFNAFLAEIKSNGVYDDMVKRWLKSHGSVMPVIENTGVNGMLRVGTCSDIGLPFSSRVQDSYEGFDVELALRFGAHTGKKVVISDMPFGSLLSALSSGKTDLILSSVAVTEERSRQIDFSDPYYDGSVSILGKKKTTESEGYAMATLDDIADKRVGIFTGTVHDAFMASAYPAATVLRFESSADMMMSLKSEKIDAAMFDRITAGLVLKRNPDLGLLTDEVLDMPLGVGFNKNNPELLAEFNAFLKEIRADGTYDQMHQRWFVNDAETAVMPAFEARPDGRKLTVGVSVEDLPYVAVMNGKYVGFDIEMMQTFASRKGYNLELVTIEFPALVAALSSGKVDMITDGIAISAERAKQINFSDEYATFRTSVIALKKNLAGYESMEVVVDKKGFLTRLSESFHNNMVHEQRYLMILRGLLVTIIISVFSAIFGTLLGGLVCWMRMSRNRFAARFAAAYIGLIRGTPVLVLLMIIYYVVFASVNLNPVIVAVIAFGINFAAYVSEMFRTGIEGVDKGQKEAGIAGGFTKVQTFIHIIMPQALRQVLPVYKGEFVSLVKMTSIVGYIAVEDLTKASDIIRSRTFDAFFPLIMAAVIYIIIAWLLTLVLDYVEVRIDPKKRRLQIRKASKP